MAIKLRRKRPFWCIGVVGLPRCQAPLAESDDTRCPSCAAKQAECEERFFNKPVFDAEPTDLPKPRRIWPE